MARRARNAVPDYLLHKASGKAYVNIDGKVIYLPGEYESKESRAEYDRLVALWMLNGRRSPVIPTVPFQAATAMHPIASAPSPVITTFSAVPATLSFTVGQFVLEYLRYAENRYAKTTQHFYSIRAALRPIVKYFENLPLVEFGPKKLIQVRRYFIQKNMVRREVNRRVAAIKNAVRWAVAQEFIPGEVIHRLDAVSELRRGEDGIREGTKVRPVNEELMRATLPHLPPEIATMVEVQFLTGMRPGEVCIMRAMDINMGGEVWLYKPMRHKTEEQGFERIVAIGPRAQALLRPFLTGDPKKFLFSPVSVVARQKQVLHEQRVTPASCGNTVGTNRKESPLKTPGDRYTTQSYGRAVDYAIRKAFPLPSHLDRQVITPTGRKKKPRRETPKEWRERLSPEQKAEIKSFRKSHHWHVHQLRHSCATRVREEFGLDGSAATLGHASIAATQVYAELQRSKAIEIMRKLG